MQLQLRRIGERPGALSSQASLGVGIAALPWGPYLYSMAYMYKKHEIKVKNVPIRPISSSSAP